ncbi:MAG: transposase, partial [Candidatus Hydrogenedentes bacterium]|nr:transposase [Candidatus Hydrogenedentota bacterium]
MSRVARIVVPGVYHHITQRGNNGQDVFFVDDDRRVYLALLREQARRFEFRVEGYCLMSNHVHVVGVPEREESLAKAIGRTHFLYTQYVNRRHGRGGHLWQNRFFSCPMDEDYAWHGLAYVELNPVRAGRVRKAWEW